MADKAIPTPLLWQFDIGYAGLTQWCSAVGVFVLFCIRDKREGRMGKTQVDVDCAVAKREDEDLVYDLGRQDG